MGGLLRDRLLIMCAMQESSHTKPSEFCPHPERWHAHDGKSAEVEVAEFIAALVRVSQPDLVFESGTAYGHTSLAIGKALETNGHGLLVTCEVHEGRLEAARKRCSNLPIEFLHMSSLEWIPTGRLGLVFFDGLRANREAEYRRFKPYFNADTVLVFHDTAPHMRPYMAGHDSELNALRLHTPRGLTVAQVKQAPWG